MGKNYYSFIAIVISCIGILGELMVDWYLYLRYLESDNKSRALELIELYTLDYKFAIVVGGLIGFILILIGLIKKESKKYLIFGLVMSVVTIFLPFLGLYRYFT